MKAERHTQQQQAVNNVVKSLTTMLGDRDQVLVEELGDKMRALSGADMHSVAKSMANAALKETSPSSAGRCSCLCTRC